MQLKSKKFILIALAAGVVLWLFYEHSKVPETFRYHVNAGGFDSPVFVYYIRLNKNIGFPFGGIIDGRSPDDKVFGSSMGLYKPEPVPHQIDARWFAYQTEEFYEISLQIPEEKQQQIRDWYRQYPERDYSHSLQLGLSGKGDLRLYWQANCRMLEGCPSEPRKLLEIYDRLPVEGSGVTLGREHFNFIYRREELLCHAFFRGKPNYHLPDDLLVGSENLDDYRRVRVFRESGDGSFNYRLEYRDGTTTTGAAIRDETARNSFWVEWEDPYNPPYKLFMEDEEGNNNLRWGDRFYSAGYNVQLYHDWNILGYDYTDYFYLDQRFLLPSRAYFEWPEWAQEMHWQDFRRDCKGGLYMRLIDTNGDIVRFSSYELIDLDSGEIISEGVTDFMGFTDILISDYRTNNWRFR